MFRSFSLDKICILYNLLCDPSLFKLNYIFFIRIFLPSEFSYFCILLQYFQSFGDNSSRRKIRLIESNAKCRQLKKFTGKATFRQVFLLSEVPPLLGFCLRLSSNFVGFESVQIQSVKLLQNMGVGGGELEKRLEGQYFTKLGRKYQHNWLHHQSINSNKH